MNTDIIILGAGESGYGAALLAKAVGLRPFVSDAGSIKQEYRLLLQKEDIEFEEGGHSIDRIMQCTTIIKSPGIPETASIIVKARENGIAIISEIEFACRYTQARKICITGSNGKTTTTSIIYKILQTAQYRVAVVGNIGMSMAHSLALTIMNNQQDYDWYVVELSSFQIDGMYDAKAEVAVMLNITPDHLDRYQYSLELYAQSKMRLARNQTKSDYFIYNADDPITVDMMSKTPIGGTAIPFSTKSVLDGAYYAAGELCFNDFRMPASELQIKGIHNISNALAAISATHSIGVGSEYISQALREFSGVEHRMESVGKFDGIEFINDSKATNVDSTWYALDSMKHPTVWIAGGTDKGNDYTSLLPLAKEHVKTLICLGLDNNKLIKAFEGVVPHVENCHSLEDAMKMVRQHAVSGDTVLLSPACASFDLFKNYEDRGRKFKEAVILQYK